MSTPKLINEKSLLFPLVLTGLFFFVEALGGVLTGSLALLSDAAYMLSDLFALLIAYLSVKLSQKANDGVHTISHHKFEIMSGVINAVLLFLIAFYILLEALLRLNRPYEIQSTSMLLIAFIGLIINLICMMWLHPKKDLSLSFKGAYLEVLSDALGSVAVILSALLMKWFNWPGIDSIFAIFIAFWILPRACALLKKSMNLLTY